MNTTMGSFVSRLNNLFGKGEKTKIIMIGLDNAGKTSILYKMKINENIHTIPTLGFNVETLTPAKGVTFTVWDVGGQDRIRALWRHYFQNIDGVLFVVDSSDVQRMQEARDELFSILENNDLRGVPIVVLANKQDALDAMTAEEVTKHLYLNKTTGREWCVQQTCATSGEGLFEAFHQIAELTKAFKASKRRRS